MQVEWEQMPTKELEKLIADAQVELLRREEEQRQKVFEKMKKLADSVGISFRVTEKTKKSRKKKPSLGATLPPKYRNPENSEETWTGRGRKPPFIKSAEERGEDIEQFRIAENEAA